MTDLDPAITAPIDVLPSGDLRNDTASVQIEMTSLQVRALRDYLDSVDIPDISSNPSYHGLDDGDAQDFAAVLANLQASLSKAYPY